MAIQIKDLIAEARAQGCPARYSLLEFEWVVSIVNGRSMVMQNGSRTSQKDAQATINATYERQQRGYSVEFLEASAEYSSGTGSRKATVNGVHYWVHWFISQGFKYTVDDEPVTRDEFKRRIDASAFSERHPRKSNAMNTDNLHMWAQPEPVAIKVEVDSLLAARYEAMHALLTDLLPSLNIMTLCMDQMGDSDTADKIRTLIKLAKNE